MMTAALTLLAGTIAAMFVATAATSLFSAFREEAGQAHVASRRIFH